MVYLCSPMNAFTSALFCSGIGVFLVACSHSSQEPAERPAFLGTAAVKEGPEKPAAPAKEVAPVDYSGVALQRASTLLKEEASWQLAWEIPRDKIAPCAAMAPSFEEPPESTHKKGEKFFTYLPKGVEAYRAGLVMPVGSAVVKRTFLPGTNQTTGYFFMLKEAGSNPDGGDWLYATMTAAGEPIRGGRLSSCMKCHKKMSSNDYLFRRASN